MSRWQPPPMNDQQPAGAKKLIVDEQVVRKMLQVNPALRKGRTTFQVKKAIERGDGLTREDSRTATSEAPRTFGQADARDVAPRSDAQELVETIDFFVRGKADKLKAGLDEIDARRRQLDAEEAQVRAKHCDQLISFFSLLDDGAVALNGKKALAKHSDFLAKVGLTSSTLLERINRTRK
ncbi:MAG: hypothetical protein A2289_13645 [Deltaproteobacteria bacterium RIFOXYA12_FULL_58_15]|nr:MAG: hypothetical protein A2289_13645 [Deltaproteobacteria bacterium RIFOXYA12_FULL_58_15]